MTANGSVGSYVQSALTYKMCVGLYGQPADVQIDVSECRVSRGTLSVGPVGYFFGVVGCDGHLA
jgi:hypothetical protein